MELTRCLWNAPRSTLNLAGMWLCRHFVIRYTEQETKQTWILEIVDDIVLNGIVCVLCIPLGRVRRHAERKRFTKLCECIFVPNTRI